MPLFAPNHYNILIVSFFVNLEELLAFMKSKASIYSDYARGLTGSGAAMHTRRIREDVESDEERRKKKREAKERGRGLWLLDRMFEFRQPLDGPRSSTEGNRAVTVSVFFLF